MLRRLEARVPLAMVLAVLLAGCASSGSGGFSGNLTKPAVVTPTAQVAPTQTTAVSDQLPALEDGWTLATVQSEGFAIGLPPGWTQFDLTHDGWKQAINVAEENNPQISNGLSDQLTSMAAEGIKLSAFDLGGNFATTGFATNLTLLTLDLPAHMELDTLTVSAIAGLKKQFDTDTDKPMQFETSRIGFNSGEAARIQFSRSLKLPGGKIVPLTFSEYVTMNERKYFVLTYVTPQAEFASYSQMFDKSVESLTFLR